MTGEVFGCFRPWEIARLTDYQIRHVYLLPAVKRSAETEARAKGQPVDTTAADIEDMVRRGERPSKASIIQLYVSHGMSADGAARVVEDQWKEWDEMDAKVARERGE